LRVDFSFAGRNPSMFRRRRKRGEKHRADKQQGDPQALDREGDPRGGATNIATPAPLSSWSRTAS
jgi:hypothetical protein